MPSRAGSPAEDASGRCAAWPVEVAVQGARTAWALNRELCLQTVPSEQPNDYSPLVAMTPDKTGAASLSWLYLTLAATLPHLRVKPETAPRLRPRQSVVAALGAREERRRGGPRLDPSIVSAARRTRRGGVRPSDAYCADSLGCAEGHTTELSEPRSGRSALTVATAGARSAAGRPSLRETGVDHADAATLGDPAGRGEPRRPAVLPQARLIEGDGDVDPVKVPLKRPEILGDGSLEVPLRTCSATGRSQRIHAAGRVRRATAGPVGPGFS